MFFENSKIPVWLSKVSPIEIGAITLGPLVFSRGEMSIETKNHESIHWQQYRELLVIGFPILYVFYWILGLIKYKNPSLAYYRIPFEQEAYNYDEDLSYLSNRDAYAWREFKV